jgi:hypothetical protein
LQQRGSVSERSEKLQRIAAGAGLEARAQIGPGLAQRVFVQRRGSALARRPARPWTPSSATALARPACPAGSRRLPASKSICTSTMGMTGLSTSQTWAPLGSGPVLDGQQRPGEFSTKQGSSAYQ